MNRHFLFLGIFVISQFILIPHTAFARITSVTGYCSVREGYDSNIDRTESDHTSGWTTTISPAIELSTESSNDRLAFKYAPGFSFNHETDENDTNHHLSLIGRKDFSSRLRVTFNERFVRSDNTYIEEILVEKDSKRLLEDSKRNRRQWTNTFSIKSEYEYASSSLFVLGYSNHILDHTNSTEDDYVRHNPYTSISYQFTPRWSIASSYSHVEGDFDSSEDLTRQTPGLRLTHNISPHTALWGDYTFSRTDYDGNKTDYKIHAGSLGLTHQLDQKTNITTSLGYSNVDSDTTSNDGINYSIDFSRLLAKGQLSVSGSGGYDNRQFTGNVDDGLTKFWSFGSRFKYQLASKIAMDIYGSIRMDDFIEQQQNTEEDTYEGGGGLNFSFWRWFSLALRYSYLELDSEINTNDYKDHRCFAEIKFAKELWRQ